MLYYINQVRDKVSSLIQANTLKSFIRKHNTFRHISEASFHLPFFAKTSDYFYDILWSSYTDLPHQFGTSVSHMLKGLFTNCDTWLVSSYFAWIVEGATCETASAHSFRNTWFHSRWGVHDFTRALYIHYRICLCLYLRINDDRFVWDLSYIIKFKQRTL